MKKNKKKEIYEMDNEPNNLNETENEDTCECEDCCDEENCLEDKCECEDCNNEEQKQSSNEYLELAQRIQAEFDNYRKRNVEAVKEAEQKGVMKTVEKILPVFDSINSAKRQVTSEEFKKAIETLHSQLLQILEGMNVKKIEAVGLPFDPNKHNAVLVEEREGFEPDIVLEELQEGFEMNGKVIRHSVVKVSK